MRLIDADALKEDLTYDFTGHPLHGNMKTTMGNIRAMILMQPTIDAMPVVRCPQCIHYEENGYHFCNKWEHFLPDDSEFFCAYGEHMDKEDN